MTIYISILHFQLANRIMSSSISNHLYKFHIQPIHSACSWQIISMLGCNLAKLNKQANTPHKGLDIQQHVSKIYPKTFSSISFWEGNITHSCWLKQACSRCLFRAPVSSLPVVDYSGIFHQLNMHI